jgi:hypothetical protein
MATWRDVSARKIVVPVLFSETINCEKYLRVERTAFSTPPVICELYLIHSERYRPLGMVIHRQICMRLAGSGAPAAVKRIAVDPVHTLKILPV